MANAGYPFYKAWKANGVQPAAGYLLYTYVSGSTVPKITYRDAGFVASNTNPIVLDANGEATIFLGDGPYRFDLKTPSGALVNTFDPISNPTGGGTVSFAAPSAVIGLTMIPGVATTAMRSDGAPALSQAIVPTWSAQHTFTLAPIVSALAGVGNRMVVADAAGTLGVQAIPTAPVGANPSASIGLAAVNGSASTFLRSDGAPALSQAIAPTWSAQHTFTLAPIVSALTGVGNRMVIASAAGTLGVQAIPTAPTGANPSASIGLAAVNGSAATFLRSDGAPALSQAIVPTWSAQHTFTLAPIVSAFVGTGDRMVYSNSSGQTGVQAIPGTVPGDFTLKPTSTAPSGYTYTGKIFDRTFPWTNTTLNLTAVIGSTWASYQGTVYVMGGDTGGAVTSINATVNLSDPLATVNKLGVPAAYQYSAAESDGAGLIFYCGGANHAGVAVTDLYVYNIGANTWATPTAMPGVRWKHCVAIYSGNMYVFGGANNGPALVTATYVLSLGGGTWTSTAATMTTPRINARCGVIGGKIYVIGGNTTTGTVSPTSAVECYDVAGNSWSTKTSLPVATSEGQIIALGNLIWYLGGQISVGGAYKTTRKTYIYDSLSDLWYTGPSLNFGRSSGCTGISGTDIWVGRGQTIVGTPIGTTELSSFPQEPTYLMSKN